MAVRDFAIDLIEELLKDKELALAEENIRFYDKGTTAETDESLDDHIRWRNARYYNADSNVIRSSLLIVQLPVGYSAEYINFHVGKLYRLYRKDGMSGVLPIVKRDIRDLKDSEANSSKNTYYLWRTKVSPSTLTAQWPQPLYGAGDQRGHCRILPWRAGADDRRRLLSVFYRYLRRFTFTMRNYCKKLWFLGLILIKTEESDTWRKGQRCTLIRAHLWPFSDLILRSSFFNLCLPFTS